MLGGREPVFELNMRQRKLLDSRDENFDLSFEFERKDLFELFVTLKQIFEKQSPSERLFYKEFKGQSLEMDVKSVEHETSEVEVLLEDDELRNQVFSLTVNPYSKITTVRSQGTTIDVIQPDSMKDEIHLQSRIASVFQNVLDDVTKNLSGVGKFKFDAEMVFNVGSVK
jgi:hypothetical protein